MKKKVFIISDSSSGILLASLIENAGHNVTLICTGDNFNPALHHRNFLIPFYPDHPDMHQALEQIKPLLLNNLSSQVIESQPLTHEDKLIKPFVGFGDATTQATKELSFYNSNKRIELSLNLESEIPGLISRFKGKIIKYGELKSIEFSETKIDKIILNGAEEQDFDQLIFMNPPNDLTQLIPNDVLGVRIKSRIAKTESWSRLTMSYTHTETIFEGNNCIFLTHNTPKENCSCVGVFAPSQTNSDALQNSIWETYIPNDFGDDAEYVSSTIKTMRKLIRKAFPQTEGNSRESLVVTQRAAANFTWFHESKEISQIAENFIFSPELSYPWLGMARSVLAATATFESFQKQISQDLPLQTEPTTLSSAN